MKTHRSLAPTAPRVLRQVGGTIAGRCVTEPVGQGSASAPAAGRPRCLVLLALLAVLLCPGPARAFTAPDGAFTVDLPGDWVPIPTLELYLAEHPGNTGPVSPSLLADFKKQRFGFQQQAEKWFTPPYVIIALESGVSRGPQEMFMDHVLARRDAEASGRQGYRFLEKGQRPLQRMQYHKDMAYSPAHGKNMIMGSYTYLTSQGYLRLAWFIGEDQRAEFEETLHQAALGLKLAPGMEYKAGNAGQSWGVVPKDAPGATPP